MHVQLTDTKKCKKDSENLLAQQGLWKQASKDRKQKQFCTYDFVK